MYSLKYFTVSKVVVLSCTYLIEVQSGRVHVPWEGWQAAVEPWRPDLSSWLVKLTKCRCCNLCLKKSCFVIFSWLAAQKCCSWKIFSKTPLLQLLGKCSLLPQLILLDKKSTHLGGPCPLDNYWRLSNISCKSIEVPVSFVVLFFCVSKLFLPLAKWRVAKRAIQCGLKILILSANSDSLRLVVKDKYSLSAADQRTEWTRLNVLLGLFLPNWILFCFQSYYLRWYDDHYMTSGWWGQIGQMACFQKIYGLHPV